MNKPSDWSWVKGKWMVCTVHNRILYQRLHCDDSKTWRHKGPFTGGSCEGAGPFDTREAAERWMDKNEVIEFLEEE